MRTDELRSLTALSQHCPIVRSPGKKTSMLFAVSIGIAPVSGIVDRRASETEICA
jgi:hypothetical protein